MITNVIASAQTAEALKILIGLDLVRKEWFSVDLWANHTAAIEIKKNSDCPVCVRKQYEYLGKVSGSYTTSICGSNSIQIVPAKTVAIDFSAIAGRLKKIGVVSFSQYSLIFSNDNYEIMFFGDGRAMIKNPIDENNAKSVYSEYIGL